MDINQTKIIASINQYLAWHDLPVRLDKRGICNGSSTTYIKYCLEGKRKFFAEMLEQIASMPPDTVMDSQLNHVATEIVITAYPDLFDPERSQDQSFETLAIEGVPLRSSFNLALVASNNDWIDIFKGIALKSDEAILVRSFNHAIAVSKESGRYIIYDPNYTQGFKAFKTEKELVHELNYRVFKYTPHIFNKPRPLGLHIDVFRHPSSNTSRIFPNTKDLYNKYCTPELFAEIDGLQIQNLHYAFRLDNSAILNILCDKNITLPDPVQMACGAISANSKKLLVHLLEKIPDGANLKKLFSRVLSSGRITLFDILMANEHCQNYFMTHILVQEKFIVFLNKTVKGFSYKAGNEAMLQKLLNLYQTQAKPHALSDQDINDVIANSLANKDNPISIAIKSGSLACIKLINDQLNKTCFKYTDEQLLTFLLQAIKKNDSLIVDFFISQIQIHVSLDNQKLIYKSIYMSYASVESTDLCILRQLKKQEVPFSKHAQAIITQKEAPSRNQLSLFKDLLINLLTYFIEDLTYKIDDKNRSLDTFKFFKTQSNLNQSKNEQLLKPDSTNLSL